MARPTDTSKHINGEPCSVCGSTLKYRKRRQEDGIGACVACTRRYNAQKYARRNGNEIDLAGKPATPIPRTALASALDYYTRSPSSTERSRYLDQRVRAHYASLLGETVQAKPAVMTAGDAHRATLPVGYVPPHVMTKERDAAAVAQRHAENDAVREAIKAARPKLADLVTIGDLIAALPAHVAEPVNPSRLPQVIAKILADMGHRPASGKTGQKRLYSLRNGHRHRRMQPVQLWRAYTAMVNGGPGMAAQRPSARRAVGHRGRPAANAGLVQSRLLSHSRQMEG